MTKEELVAAMAAFEQGGGKVQEIEAGVSGERADSTFNTTIKFCGCGCHGDWTDHRMREAENGKFR
jgi:hypothetical protein